MPSEHPMLAQFAYQIPTDLIAHTPVEPRDTARLFVYDTTTEQVHHTTVRELPRYIAGTTLIYNDTRVLPARLHGIYDDAAIELLVLIDQGVTEDGTFRALVNRRVHNGGEITVADEVFVVLDNREKSMVLKTKLSGDALSLFLLNHGETPLPPYITSEADEATKRHTYQTHFAASLPSVAAPTASLHFTPSLIEQLTNAAVTMSPVTLQVGLGTFAPIFTENFVDKKLHTEFYAVPKATADAIGTARRHGRPIVGVGTTVVRTLESAKEVIQQGNGTSGKADLFIFSPYTFTYPDVLMTNFHVPKSSLMCLVQAFIEHKGGKRHLTDLYAEAIEERYRFYSFGDAMLVV